MNIHYCFMTRFFFNKEKRKGNESRFWFFAEKKEGYLMEKSEG